MCHGDPFGRKVPSENRNSYRRCQRGTSAAAMATHDERKQSTRSRILDAAARVLVERGLVGFRAEHVIAEAGVGAGSLYRHFGSLAGLLAATAAQVLAGNRDTFEASLPAAEGRALGAEELLPALWAAMSDPRLAAVYELYTASRTDAELRARLAPILADHVGHIRRLAGVHAGAALGDATARGVELAVLAFQGLVVSLMIHPDPEAHRRLIETLLGIAQHYPAPRG